MHSTQLLQVLAVALTTFSVANASVDGPQAPRIPQMHEIVKRQSVPESSSSSPSRSSTTTSARPVTTSTTPPSSSREATTPATPTTPNPTTPTPTTPGPTTPAPTSSTSSTTSPNQNTTPDPSESSTLRTTLTTVIITTNSDGSATTQTSQIVQETTVPNSKSNENKGMDEKQRNDIIGGVVGGVGGAIFLAVIGLVAWRVWGRKKNQEEVDNTFGTSAYNVAEKPEPAAGSTNSRTPFQSTLESYHAPTQVNTASNF